MKLLKGRSRRRSPKRRIAFESLEERQLLTVGPYLHTNVFYDNSDRLVVVDASSGDVRMNKMMTGFVGGDERIADIAFSPEGTLFGVTSSRLYEISTIDASLTPLGEHGIDKANSLVFTPQGKLRAMARESAELFELTIEDGSVAPPRSIATLSGMSGSAGDIAYSGSDLVVATTDDKLMWYRFDFGANRPRIVDEFDLADVGITEATGLAVVDGRQLYVTASGKIVEFALPTNQPTGREIEVGTQPNGYRGAAHYREAGGPVPTGTLSGVKWNDANADGERQSSESLLPDWEFYIDLNLDGQRNNGEPLEATDEQGRFHFFGYEPGFYTVDEVSSALGWRQTFPVSPHRNLIGVYNFDTPQAENSLFHEYGLPNISLGTGATSGGNSQLRLASNRAYAVMPMALGQSPFSIVVDASYQAIGFNDGYLISQGSSTDIADVDFKSIVSAGSLDLTTSFCNETCHDATQGPFEFDDVEFAITWNGSSVGNYLKGKFKTTSVTGTLPDIDGEGVRFGDPLSDLTGQGAIGNINEIRIYNAALSPTELNEAFTAAEIPTAYSVILNDTFGIDGLDFGNVFVQSREIDIRADSLSGPAVPDSGALDLGTAAQGEPAPARDLWIRNVGTEPLNISSVNVTPGFRVSGFTSGTLASNEAASITITLTDTMVGTKIGELTIANNDTNENPYDISLSAEITGLSGEPEINVRRFGPSGFPVPDDGTVPLGTTSVGGPPPSDTLWIENEGDGPLDLSSIDVVGDFVVIGFEPTTLNQDEGTLIVVSLDDTTSPGNKTGRVIVNSNDTNESEYTINLTATVIAAAPDIEVRADTISGAIVGDDFDVGVGTDTHLPSRSIWIVNTGPDVLDVSDITVTGNFSVVGDTDLSLSQGQGFSVIVVVADLSFGQKHGDLTISSNDPDEDPFSINLFANVIDIHQELLPEDVNDDGQVSPIDALLIINEINAPQFTIAGGELQGEVIGVPVSPTRFPDVTNDGFVVASDAVAVINYINSNSAKVVAVFAAEPVFHDRTHYLNSNAIDFALWYDQFDAEDLKKKIRSND